MTKRLRRPGHATVIAYAALFVALGGTAIAAKKITTEDIAKKAVTGSKIDRKAVKGGKIDREAVKKNKIADKAVVQTKLAPGSVGTAKLQDNSISGAKVNTGAIKSANISSNAIDTSKIAGGAVSGSKVANGAISGPKIANGAISGPKVPNGALGLEKVAQLVADVAIDFSGVTPCAADTATVPGIDDLAYVLVIPGGTGWDPALVIDQYGATGTDTIGVQVCDVSGGTPDPDPVPFRVLGFA